LSGAPRPCICLPIPCPPCRALSNGS
jgi:hypothetical protein